MCGRINVSDHPGVQLLLDLLDIPLYPSPLPARYNIAPGAKLLTIIPHNDKNELMTMQWGILPARSNANASKPIINARSETIWEKSSFRHLIASQRAIVPINSFYEWNRKEGNKIPYSISPSSGSTFAIASIFQTDMEGKMRCCLITTEANQKMQSIHNRMPVILENQSLNDWLYSSDRNQVDSLMKPSANETIKIQQVSEYVNNASHEGPECMNAVEDQNLDKSGPEQQKLIF